MRAFDIFFFFMAAASCRATTCLIACTCASSENTLLLEEIINPRTYVSCSSLQLFLTLARQYQISSGRRAACAWSPALFGPPTVHLPAGGIAACQPATAIAPV